MVIVSLIRRTVYTARSGRLPLYRPPLRFFLPSPAPMPDSGNAGDVSLNERLATGEPFSWPIWTGETRGQPVTARPGVVPGSLTGVQPSNPGSPLPDLITGRARPLRKSLIAGAGKGGRIRDCGKTSEAPRAWLDAANPEPPADPAPARQEQPGTTRIQTCGRVNYFINKRGLTPP